MYTYTGIYLYPQTHCNPWSWLLLTQVGSQCHLLRAFFLLGSDDVDDDDYDDPLLILGMAKMSKWSGYLKAKIIADGIRGGDR